MAILADQMNAFGLAGNYPILTASALLFVVAFSTAYQLCPLTQYIFQSFIFVGNGIDGCRRIVVKKIEYTSPE